MGMKARLPVYEETSMYYVYLCKITGILPLEGRVKYLPVIYFPWISAVFYSMHTAGGVRMLLEQEFNISFVFESIVTHGLCARFLVLFLQGDQVGQLMEICRRLCQLLIDGEEKIVRRFEKKVRYLMHFFFWTALAAIMFYNVTAYFIRLPPATVNGTERRILPIRFYVDVQEDPWFQIILTFENIIFVFFAIVITTIETVGPFFIMMACGFLRSIQYRLTSMTSAELNSSFTNVKSFTNVRSLQHLPQRNLQDVLNCVNFHQKVINFYEKIKILTEKLFIIQVLCSAYNISLIGIKLLEDDQKAMQYLPILILNLLQLFTCQWIPEHLLNESKEIANAAYSAMMAHPADDPKVNRTLLFMMLRAQKPLEMKAGYIMLSLESFARLCTSAISFFTVLRSVNVEDE